MDNTRLQKHALNYKPRGRRDRGRPRERWQRVEAGRGQKTYPRRKMMMMTFWIVPVCISHSACILTSYDLQNPNESFHAESQHVSCTANAPETYLDDIRFEFQLYNLPHNYWLFSVRPATNWMSVNPSHHNSLIPRQIVTVAEQRR